MWFSKAGGIRKNGRNGKSADEPSSRTPKGAKMRETFPVQGGYDRDTRNELGPSEIPMWLAEIVYAEYSRRYGTGQSLKRLGESGGFDRGEVLEFLRDAAADPAEGGRSDGNA